MAGPVPQSGAMVACPNCNAEVMQKAMIPVGALDGVPFYLCVVCSRQSIRTGSAEPTEQIDRSDPSAPPELSSQVS